MLPYLWYHYDLVRGPRAAVLTCAVGVVGAGPVGQRLVGPEPLPVLLYKAALTVRWHAEMGQGGEMRSWYTVKWG